MTCNELAEPGRTVRVSVSAVAHGWGSDPWKWVSWLDRDDLAVLRSGGTVLVWGCPPAHGNHGTTYRRVVWSGRWTHRLPSAEDLAAVERRAAKDPQAVVPPGTV